MKYSKITLIICFFLSVFGVKNSISQTGIKIDCTSIEKPLNAFKGQLLNIQCDSIIVISPNRFRLYEKARNAILTTNYEKYNEIFNAYDTQMLAYKQWNDSLQLKYNEISTAFKTSLESTRSSLISINNNLSTAKDSLGLANNNLNEALQHLKSAKREKWYFGAIGFLAGTLATVLLITK